MFKSKPIGWITALTLLAVAGVALACRLKEGAGEQVQGDTVARADVDKTPAPPTETPAATPLPDPPPPLPEKNTKDELPPVPPLVVPVTAPPAPADTAAVPLPAPLNARYEDVPKKEPVATNPPPSPEISPDAKIPVPAVEPVPALPVSSKAEGTPSSTVPLPVQVADPAMPAVLTPAVAAPSSPVVKPDPAEKAAYPVEELSKRLDGGAGSPAVPDNKTYWATQGETLRDVARKTLGQEDRWREIEKLNPELRARTLIPAGTMVRVPAAAQNSGIKLTGGQSEPGYVTSTVKASASSVRPVPVIRARPEDRLSKSPMMGTFECKMDGKGGLALPKEVCEQMGKCETILLTPGPDGCLWMVCQDEAVRMLHRIEKAQVGDAEVQAFKRLYFSQTQKASVDTAGGLKVPEKLADFAGLAGEAVLIGMDDHFELWEAARWHRYSQQKSSVPQKTAHDGIE